MIEQLIGDHIEIYSNEHGIEIRTGIEVIHLSDAQWRELVYLLEIVGKASNDRPA